MQMIKPSSSSSDHGNQQQNPDNSVNQSISTISSKFNQSLHINQTDNPDLQKSLPDPAGYSDEEDEDEFVDCEDEEDNNHEPDASDFTFMYIDKNNSPIPADEAAKSGQVQQVFPLFDQNLLSGDEGDQVPGQSPVDKVFVESPQPAPPSSTAEHDGIEGTVAERNQLPVQPPVDKVLDESPQRAPPSSTAEHDGIEGTAAENSSSGNQLPVQPPVDKMFVESPQQPPPSSSPEHDGTEGIAAGPYCTPAMEKPEPEPEPELNKKSNSTGFSKLWRLRGKIGRSNSDGRDAFVIMKGSDRKTTSLKELYLKKKEQTEEERRRTYLPYRPKIMRFFNNLKGGLNKNVHPST